MPGTHGDWAKVYINGHDLTGDSNQLSYAHQYGDNRVMPFNTGVEQHAPGVFMPNLNYNGYCRKGQGAITAWNLLKNSTDTEYMISALMGFNGTPVAGNPAAQLDGT